MACALAGGAQREETPWTGILRDSRGQVVAGATLNAQSGAFRGTATTGKDGRFTFPALPAGEYTISATRQGATAACPRTVRLPGDGSEALLEWSMNGELSLTQNPAGRGGAGGQQLSSKAVSELPLNKRDFSQLLLLAAGTMTDSNGATNFTAQFAINGQRGVGATFAMDGADISDPEMGGATFSNFNVDAVEGIDSSSGWMPAEIGRGAAGFTSIRTRSGASGFHGSFFEFVRNSAFDARNYFDHSTEAYQGRIPPFRRNEFGFTNGGTVQIPHLYDGRGRTYYFLEYQGFRQVLGTTQVMPVPSLEQRPANGSQFVYDTVLFPDPANPNVMIPDTLTVPVDQKYMAAILERYPKPNLLTGPYGANTYATASKVATDADQVSLRLDHKIGGKDQLFARFTLDNLFGPTTNPDQIGRAHL